MDQQSKSGGGGRGYQQPPLSSSIPLPLKQKQQTDHHIVDMYKLKKMNKNCNNSHHHHHNSSQQKLQKNCTKNNNNNKNNIFKTIILISSGILNEFLMPNPKYYEKSSIYRRARLLTYLCIIYFLIFAIGLALFDPLYPIFIFSVAAMFTIYVMAMRSYRFTVTCLLYTFIQMIIYISITIVYFTRLNSEKQQSLVFYTYFNLFDLVGVLVSITIFFPSFWFCGSLLLIINLANCALNLFVHYYLIVSRSIIFQNIIISLATSCLLLFYSYITTVDLKEIEEREERIRTLFNISSEALVIHKNGIILDANTTFENMFQVKLDSILNPVPAAIWEFLPNIEHYLNKSAAATTPQAPDHCLLQNQPTFLLDNKKVIETIAINSSGEEFSVEVRSEKKEYLSNPVDIVSIIDTNSRKKLIEADLALRKAEAINEAKINFLTNISHEVRTPINGILASVDILEKTNLDNTQHDFLVCIKDSSSYLLDLITDILDFSKIESGKMKLQPVEFNIITMLEETMNIVYTTTKERGLELILFVDPAVPIIVVADHYRIKQILLNFLSNAIKFTSTGQVIIRVNFVSSTATSDTNTEFKLSFEVEDSGIGLHQEQIEKLFTAFLQFDNQGSRNFQGTGLGLSISKKLCNLMGGEITVNSTYGSGSTFAFTCNVQSTMDAWTYGSLSSCLSLRSDNHSMIHTNNDKFSCSKIKGYVFYNNEHMRKSAVQLFGLLDIDIMPLDDESSLLSIFQSPSGVLHPANRKRSTIHEETDTYLILVPDTSCHLEEYKHLCQSSSLNETNAEILVYWILISENTPDYIDPFFSSILKIPLHLPTVVESLYFIQKVPIPLDIYFLLTNTKSSKTNDSSPSSHEKENTKTTASLSSSSTNTNTYSSSLTSNPSSSLTITADDYKTADRRRHLTHQRNSSYSDHVPITRGLVQINRSPRTNSDKTTESPSSFIDLSSSKDFNLHPSSPPNQLPPLYKSIEKDHFRNNQQQPPPPSLSSPVVEVLDGSSITPPSSSNSSSNSTPPLSISLPSSPISISTATTNNIPTITTTTTTPSPCVQPTIKEIQPPTTSSQQPTPRRINNSEETVGDSRSLSYSSFTSNLSTPLSIASTPSMVGAPVSPSIPPNHQQHHHHQQQQQQQQQVPSPLPHHVTRSPSSLAITDNNSSSNLNLLQMPNNISPKITLTGQRSPLLSPHLSTSSLSRKVSIPQLDLDSQKQEFHRKSKSTLAGGSATTLIESPRLTKPFKILLVEDNLVNCKVFTKFLRDGGHSISHACNGLEAINAVKSDYYPIILMDCQMPVMGGIEATKIIRKYEKDNYSFDKRYKKTFIIALTANDSSEECFMAGMNDFIQKPVRSSILLLSTIDKYIKQFSDEDIQYLSTLKLHQQQQQQHQHQ